MSVAQLDFNNTKVAFQLKTDSELERAYFLFKMISNQPLVRIGTAATNFALKTRLPVEGLIRSTVFDHFCGGINALDCIPKIDIMYRSNVCSILDYSVEGKQDDVQFDSVVAKTLELIDFAAQKKAMPFTVFKPSGVGRFKIYEKISNSLPLTKEEIKEWSKIQKRFHSICKHAKINNIAVLIDAEESWMQSAVDGFVLDLMKIYNKDSVVVFNTLQAYRWDRLDQLKELHSLAKAQKFKLGFKLVRGAYLEKERARAKALDYISPICATKEDTDLNFDSCLKYILRHLDDIHLFLGTHNEKSTLKALEILECENIGKGDSRVWFGQLLGMSDHISFNLAKLNYNVAKYLPFGPVKDVMPYLIRRAEENTSVAGQTNRELELIKKEKRRRKI